MEQSTITGFIIFLMGLCCGSFASVAVTRIPLEKPIIFGPSRCPKCAKSLQAVDLVPLLSWLFSGGKCRYCQAKIPAMYPLLELTTGSLFLLSYLKFGLTIQTILVALAGLCSIIIINIDWRYKIIPDKLQIALLILGVFYNIFVQDWRDGLLGCAAGLAIGYGLRWIFFKWKKRECLGMGDVKFFMVSGLLLGFYAFVPFLFLSGIFGVATDLLWKFRGKRDKEFPFGPALTVAMMMLLLLPEAANIFWHFDYFLLP